MPCLTSRASLALSRELLPQCAMMCDFMQSWQAWLCHHHAQQHLPAAPIVCSLGTMRAGTRCVVRRGLDSSSSYSLEDNRHEVTHPPVLCCSLVCLHSSRLICLTFLPALPLKAYVHVHIRRLITFTLMAYHGPDTKPP